MLPDVASCLQWGRFNSSSIFQSSNLTLFSIQSKKRGLHPPHSLNVSQIRFHLKTCKKTGVHPKSLIWWFLSSRSPLEVVLVRLFGPLYQSSYFHGPRSEDTREQLSCSSLLIASTPLIWYLLLTGRCSWYITTYQRYHSKVFSLIHHAVLTCVTCLSAQQQGSITNFKTQETLFTSFIII